MHIILKLQKSLYPAFKTVNNFDNVDSNVWFKYYCRQQDYDLRGHDYKLFKQRCRLNMRKYFVVIDDWNKHFQKQVVTVVQKADTPFIFAITSANEHRF